MHFVGVRICVAYLKLFNYKLKKCLSAAVLDNNAAMEFVEYIRTPKVDSMTLYRPNAEPIEGTLCITGHHLIMYSRLDHKEEMWVSSVLLGQMFKCPVLCFVETIE